LLKQLGRVAQDAVREITRQAGAAAKKGDGHHLPPSQDRSAPKLSRRYPGDYRGGRPSPTTPYRRALPDPGEVVWAWVPRGRRRPGQGPSVLLIGRDGDWFLGAYLSSTDHDADATQEEAAGRHWVEVGTGAWDTRRRASFARVDRIVRVHPDDVRGRAEKLDKPRFDKVAAGVRRYA
jgi:hypothetical protein